MQPESKLYEIAYVLKGETEEEAINNLDNLKKYVEGNGGMNLEESKPFKRRLAYPLGKVREAFSGNIKFFLKPVAVKNLEEFLRRESSLLRFLLTVSKRQINKPSRPKKIRRVAEISNSDIKEIDKKLEEILGQ
ncbi:hypothetical protein A3I27_03855 [Candidatus Giovannonibacteria bacterium RIFCSPLOWO2_02_FULL_43_11b]|uniref:Small ribosomal subunit protein bS6 n=1 Tax=Candidatus Giovannonibacteria bacterium RIFCSPHIGHO2_12_FULL_43_15 TaxID=1798341 RepID=A0A1F5WNT4_9BACT|nr:MAG: hypothetical protein A2739_00535 [Candidatus Giovannonibacteria bacterium RIFCSPHIGHO2_01_FULL_43_100]OGF66148.1 MAG: hypothetical protein A3B97_03125 [Candidatus Giovannonibacteria bacterium RIFCSPHIGHO2_02_FULL_43_32]OGF77264.1 MAG: hypothetical protein A3F23_02080 [Candidatus Giovannonibacteria bacterium RIFCSPHIGHO2_12_FULL_43_15]OGF78167.1 MAG: hypothetical protein A3A15_00440 [Candidatus Giovannonibacteria bacterium RIFCSPLOWO2_01_FULL_43_60]OGF89116.1 MAG: hypothetical protein A3